MKPQFVGPPPSGYLRRYKVEISPPEPPRAAPAPSMSTRHGLTEPISNDLTHDQRCDLFLERTGVRISRATMCRWVRDWDRREKKTIASEQNPEARWRFLAWIEVSRTGWCSSMRAARHDPALRLRPTWTTVGRVPKNRGENTSLVARSVSMRVWVTRTLTGAVDGVAFLANEQVIAPKLRPGQIVVMDQRGCTANRRCGRRSRRGGASWCCCLGTVRTSTPLSWLFRR